MLKLTLDMIHCTPYPDRIVANRPGTSGTLPDFLPLSRNGPGWPSTRPFIRNSNVDLFSHTPNAGPLPYNEIELPLAHALMKGAVPTCTNVALTYALALLLKLFDPVLIEVTVPFGPLALWTLSSFASTLSHAGIL